MSSNSATLAHSETSLSFDAERYRRDFPILQTTVHGKPLIYLDNAATTQKPQVVIDRLVQYYSTENANVHRGVHLLSQKATDAYEGSREIIRRHINAGSEKEVIFLRGCTEAINLVAQTFGRKNIRTGDEIVISAMEHHSNIVPWQMLCEETGAVLRVIPINQRGELDMDAYEALLSDRTRLVAVVHVSNALGTVNPVREITRLAHARGSRVLIDGAQAMPHMPVDVQAIDCDFYTFSGHKMFGPTGVGVLYGKEALLESMPPWQGGGDMIRSVTFEKTTWNTLPHKFEAGTPNIADFIALGEAIRYVNDIGLEKIAAWEAELLSYATEQLSAIPELRFIGTAREKASVISFVLEGVHPHDIGTIVDQQGVAIRTGHHCTQPVMNFFGVPATARASFAFYNTKEDVHALTAAIRRALAVFA